MEFLHVCPVLPTDDLIRDIRWYEKQTGFKLTYKEKGYAVLSRATQWIHLQWHANTEEDPLLGGSVIKIFVDDIKPIFSEMLEKGTVTREKIRMNTPWGTHEFGFYDLNKNAIFFVQNA